MRRGLRGDSRNCFAGLRVSVLCAVCRCGRNGQLRSSGLARYLKAAGIEVMEVERPKRRHLRRNGKGRTPSMRRLLLGRSWPTTRPENPRALMVSGGDDPDLEIGPSIGAEARVHRPQTNCRLCWLAHRRAYATERCANSLPRVWSTPVPVSALELVLMTCRQLRSSRCADGGTALPAALRRNRRTR